VEPVPNDKFPAEFVIAADASIETALAAIEANSHRSVIVVDAGGTVVGTLSDGDIRKALLNHRLLSTPVREVMNLNFRLAPSRRGGPCAGAVRRAPHIPHPGPWPPQHTRRRLKSY